MRGQDDRKRERHARDGVWRPAGGENPGARGLPDSRLYSRAARMVELGAGLDEVMAECEIPKAEAELLISLRGTKSR